MWRWVKGASRQAMYLVSSPTQDYARVLAFHNEEDDLGAKNFFACTGRTSASTHSKDNPPPFPLPTSVGLETAATAAETVGTAFNESNIPYAVGGALALGMWGPPRSTIDADINVFLPPEEVGRLLDVCNAISGFEGLPDVFLPPEEVGRLLDVCNAISGFEGLPDVIFKKQRRDLKRQT
eukprot:TRINITY_DN1992_c0_g1_i2.p1 TRINITY_DN1992_c0_g1~~TRINITY_DN1992_c0_g1_i2.p1  ORF type:complete len:180 (+),score=36.68 TRINITY_DN1992_c0_g1_i2:138-677(+)